MMSETNPNRDLFKRIIHEDMNQGGFKGDTGCDSENTLLQANITQENIDYLIIFSALKTRLLSAHLRVKRGSLMISSFPPVSLTRIARLKHSQASSLRCQPLCVEDVGRITITFSSSDSVKNE